MRRSVRFSVNGEIHEISGTSAFQTLTSFLRDELRLTGTKTACGAGECGSCSVLVARDGGRPPQAVLSCLLRLLQLDGAAITTVEGLGGHAGLVDHHGVQCGYCTPGMVVSLAAMALNGRDDFAEGLSGNLCRCTGYIQILEAARAALGRIPVLPSVPALDGASDEVMIESDGRHAYLPATWEQAVQFLASCPEARIVAGGTGAGPPPGDVLCLARIPGPDEIICEQGRLSVGTLATWQRIAEAAVPALVAVAQRVASPQIRAVGTLGGNLAGRFPYADAAVVLSVLDAEVELESVNGTRRVSIDDLRVAPGELIRRVHCRLPEPAETLSYAKVARRSRYDTAVLAAALRIRRDGDRIVEAGLAYGGASAQAPVVRARGAEAFFVGKPFAEATFRQAGRMARAELDPACGAYPLTLAENLPVRFYHEVRG